MPSHVQSEDVIVDSCVQATQAFFGGILENNFRYPLRIADAITYMDSLNAGITDGTCAPPNVADFAIADDFTYEAPEPKEAE